MAKKYEGGWGIRVRKNVENEFGDKIWLNTKHKLDVVGNAKRYENRDIAYEIVNGHLDSWEANLPYSKCDFIDSNDLCVDKLPIKTFGRFGIKNDSGMWLNDEEIFGDVKDALVFTTLEEANDNIVEDDEFVEAIPNIVNPNPERPWDVIFDKVRPEDFGADEPWFPHSNLIVKKIETDSKDGKKLLDLIFKLFGIKK